MICKIVQNHALQKEIVDYLQFPELRLLGPLTFPWLTGKEGYLQHFSFPGVLQEGRRNWGGRKKEGIMGGRGVVVRRNKRIV